MATAMKEAKASRFKRAIKIDRVLVEFAGLLSALGADELVSDVAAMRAKNACRMKNADQCAAYDAMSR